MDGVGRAFVVGLRERYVRFEAGTRKREHERHADFERKRRAYRASRNIVAPPVSPDELLGRGAPPAPPGAPGR